MFFLHTYVVEQYSRVAGKRLLIEDSPHFSEIWWCKYIDADINRLWMLEVLSKKTNFSTRPSNFYPLPPPNVKVGRGEILGLRSIILQIGQDPVEDG